MYFATLELIHYFFLFLSIIMEADKLFVFQDKLFTATIFYDTIVIVVYLKTDGKNRKLKK